MDNVHSPSTQPEIIAEGVSSPGRPRRWLKLLAEKRIKYLQIDSDAPGGNYQLPLPPSFLNILPPIPYNEDNWTVATISCNVTMGGLQVELSSPYMPQVEELWHPSLIDIFELQTIERKRRCVHECTWKSPLRSNRPMIAKMAHFPWHITSMQRETRVYRALQGTQLAPRVLGHICEQGRVVGILLEKIEGRHPGFQDLEVCQAALGRLNDLGIAHRDCHQYNFIVTENNRVVLIDFETSVLEASQEAMEEDMHDLEGDISPSEFDQAYNIGG